MRILKFGGKSLSTVEKMQNICKNIKKIYKNDKKIIVIVSAIGKTTDELIEKANFYGGENITPRELDVLLSTGETTSSALFAIMLNSMGVPAKSFQAFQLQLETFGAFQDSRIASINKKPLLNALDNNKVAVIAGFQGINKNDEITTLGRGGSDTTASAIGSVFDHNVEIYSDFDGVFKGDPRLLNYKKINNINYNTMINMSKSGAKVLDSRASEIAKNFKFNIIAKSASEFNKSGSIISDIEDNVIALSSIDNLCKIAITFSDPSKLNFILKIVLNEINNLIFYNLTIEKLSITFYISKENKHKIMLTISEKLNLLKKQK